MPFAAITALLGLWLTLPTPRADGANRLRCVWIDVGSVAPFAYETATREASAILEAVGVSTDWRKSKPGASLGPGEIVLILMPRPVHAGLPANTLGAVSRESPEGRALWLYVPTLAATLGFRTETLATLGPKDRMDLSMALGRVAAHEIIHLLLPEMEHTPAGLMAASLSNVRLVGTRPDPGGLVRKLLTSPRPAGSTSAAKGEELLRASENSSLPVPIHGSNMDCVREQSKM